MDWRRLLPASLLATGLLTLALTLVIPRAAASSQCVKLPGDDCESICAEECSDGSCCHWVHYNYPTPQ